MALSAAALRTAIRVAVEGAEPRNRPYQTPLTNSPGTGGTSFTVGDGDAFEVGDILEGPTGELSLITAIATNTLTVSRAQGAVAAENLASGDIIKKNPRFTIDQMDEAVDQTLLELNPRVFNLASETLAVTTDDWYDVADTAMEDVFSVWYIDDGDFRVPLFYFAEDPANTQPKIFVAATGFTGNVFINYRKPYAAVTDMPDRLKGMVVSGAVYRLLGGAAVLATTDPGKRTDRTVQGGQEGRDSYWWFREFVRLRDAEVVYLRDRVARLPKDRISQRARRFRK